MQSLIATFELQIDEKPSGGVIRLNDSNGKCILRICRLPKRLKFVEMDDVPFIDITCSNTTFVTITDTP